MSRYSRISLVLLLFLGMRTAVYIYSTLQLLTWLSVAFSLSFSIRIYLYNKYSARYNCVVHSPMLYDITRYLVNLAYASVNRNVISYKFKY
ncbi:hypothetical protein V1511DRAFT_29799 [Dipodascopsis uninucleata]